MDTQLIKQKILSGEITRFSDVFLYCSVGQMAKALGRSEDHIKTVRGNPLKLSIEDSIKFRKVFGISRKRFCDLVGDAD